MGSQKPERDWKARIKAELTTATGTPDEDVVEELGQHAQAMYDAARADGSSHGQAEITVVEQIERWRLEAVGLRRAHRPPAPEPPPVTATSMVASLSHDLRYAVRLLIRQPRFALLAGLTMALGIGATTTLFSVTYGVLIKPLPWPDADRLVVLKETRGGQAPRFGSFTNAAYLAWHEQASTIEEIAAWMPQTFTLSGAGDSERIRATMASASLFRVLGVDPLIGSLFDDENERAAVVVLSEGLWTQRFGRDPAVLGRVIHFDGEPRTVIGVVADAMAYPDRRSRAWVPFRVPAASGNLLHMFEAVAKLRPGVTPEQAAEEGTARGRFAANTGMTTMAIFGGDGPVGVSARPLREALTGELRRPLIVLLVAVTLLLLIGTTNIAGLQLARATARRRELAIRAALGASTGRVIRQLVVESLLLGAAGGSAGLGLAWLLHRGAATILPADFPRVHDLTMNATVVLFAVLSSVLASLMFGLLPALRVRRLNLVAWLAQDGGSPAGTATGQSGPARSRRLLVAGQVAITCVLLVSASLLARSFVELLHADRGFDPARVLGASIPMVGPGYTPERRIAVLHDIVGLVRAIPGVQHAAFTSEMPLTPGGSTASLTLPSSDPARATVRAQASPRFVSPEYFAVLGLRTIAGRPLDDSDTETSQPVAVVNQTFARRYLGETPVGAKIPMGVWGRGQQGDATIVGVVDDVRYVGAQVTTLPEMYFSSRQLKVGMRSTVATLLIRSDGDPAGLIPALRNIVRQADSGLAPAVMTLEDRLLSTSLARPRLYAVLLGSFAAVALVLTGVGLFAMLAYTVEQRRRELGVRLALGASPRGLVALVVREGIVAAGAGLLAGLVASAWLTRFFGTLLYGVTAGDRLTYLTVAIVLLIVVGAATFVPARRAALLDPLRALRGTAPTRS
jgi:predicted permease